MKELLGPQRAKILGNKELPVLSEEGVEMHENQAQVSMPAHLRCHAHGDHPRPH